jgi:2-keto-4-pentenoate hydratase/2-oxohepta-3-ene-1,7-dioic acid hydratase in catechol pathway
MQIIRYLNPAGQITHGERLDDKTARPIEGNLFGEYQSATRTDPIARLLPPIAPPNIIAIGRNYREHAAEMKAEQLPAEPLIFLKATSSLVAHADPIVLPASAPNEVDYEAELAVIIGRSARNVSEADALDYVLGYTCANDVSARDCQKRRDQQWARGKSFDTFCPLGPAIVTADAFDPTDAAIRCRLNGETMQTGRTSSMIFSVAKLISYVSHQFTLLPGTTLLTGTPSGVGAARTPPVFLRPGDTIEIEIEGIGLLRNPVVQPSQ